MKKIIYLATALALVACGAEETTTLDPVSPKITPPTDDPDLQEKVAAIEEIFYAIPKPMEIVTIIKDAGAIFDIQLTNDPNNVGSYTEKTERALNMGVYGADVNYCSAFEATNDVIYALSCAKSLGDELGLKSVFDQNIHDRIMDNAENADSVQAIITATFWEVESKLREDNKPELAAAIMIGGWVEGLNMACGQAKINLDNQAIIDRIAEQGVGLNKVIELANLYEGKNERLRNLLADLEDLKASFDKIEVNESAGSGGDSNGVPTIGKKIERTLSPELLTEISAKVFKIRNDIVG